MLTVHVYRRELRAWNWLTKVCYRPRLWILLYMRTLKCVLRRNRLSADNSIRTCTEFSVGGSLSIVCHCHKWPLCTYTCCCNPLNIGCLAYNRVVQSSHAIRGRNNLKALNHNAHSPRLQQWQVITTARKATRLGCAPNLPSSCRRKKV